MESYRKQGRKTCKSMLFSHHLAPLLFICSNNVNRLVNNTQRNIFQGSEASKSGTGSEHGVGAY